MLFCQLGTISPHPTTNHGDFQIGLIKSPSSCTSVLPDFFCCRRRYLSGWIRAILLSPSSTEEIVLRLDADLAASYHHQRHHHQLHHCCIVHLSTTGFLNIAAATTTAATTNNNGIYQTESKQSSFLLLLQLFNRFAATTIFGWKASCCHCCHALIYIYVQVVLFSIHHKVLPYTKQKFPLDTSTWFWALVVFTLTQQLWLTLWLFKDGVWNYELNLD